MLKALTVTILSFGTVLAQPDRFLAVTSTTAISTLCTQSTTAESCSILGYCCASIVIDGNPPTSYTSGVCVPADFNNIQFAESTSKSWKFTCSYKISAANANSRSANRGTACTQNDQCDKGFSGFGMTYG